MQQSPLHTAQNASKKACDIIREYREGSKSFEKHIKSSEYDFATTADLECEQAIMAMLREVYPNDAIISEETAAIAKEAQHTWIIDPIDGTYNFANERPWFGPMIARGDSAGLELAVVASPLEDMVAYAQRGKGALLNSELITAAPDVELPPFDKQRIQIGWIPQPERVTSKTILSPTLFEDGEVLSRIHKHVEESNRLLPHTGSAVGMLFQLLTGELQMIIGGGFLWDIAPTVTILDEAGFHTSDLRGNPVDWHNGAQVVITSHPAYTDDILQFVKKFLD